jgi:hypothetical protein
MREAVRIGVVALALAILIQAVTAARARSTDMFIGNYDFAPEKPEQVFGPFTFDAPFSLNEFSAGAGITNSWVELDCALVDTVSNRQYRFSNAFSFYNGVDSDGSWSEGSTRGDSLLAHIPAGSYNLVVEGATGGDAGTKPGPSVYLAMKHDVLPWQNFWIALFCVLAYPLYLVYRSRSFERQRWAQSDFGP